MKKLTLTVVAAFLVTLISCKNDVPSAPMEPAPVPATPAAPAPQKPRPEATKSQDGTSVEVGSGGLSVETKNGQNHTDVSVKGGKASVDVKAK